MKGAIQKQNKCKIIELWGSQMKLVALEEMELYTLYRLSTIFTETLLSNEPAVCKVLDEGVISNIKVYYCATYI